MKWFEVTKVFKKNRLTVEIIYHAMQHILHAFIFIVLKTKTLL